MTTNIKLAKVLEHLTKGDEAKARELLHQVFIEKARAIHEELMGEEDIDETVGGSGDMGRDLTNEIEHLDDEIDFEETFTETNDDELDAKLGAHDSDSAPDAEHGAPEDDMESLPAPGNDSESMASVEDKLTDLDAALAALKAEFAKIDGGFDDSEEPTDVDPEMGSDDVEVDPEMGSDDVDVDDEEKNVKEGFDSEDDWSLDEEFDELAESLDLEVIERDMLKSHKSPKDVGAENVAGMANGNDAKSPLPKSQTSRMGGKPVETGKGPTHNGYNLESAPKAADMGYGDNRRKKSTEGSKTVSAPKNSDTAGNKVSPLSKVKGSN